IYEGRNEQFAWALAFAGLVALPRAAAGSRRSAVALVALLTAAFWAKQTTVFAALAAALALLVTAAPAGRRRAVTIVLGLGAVNGALLAALTVLTRGWQYRFNFEFNLEIKRSVVEVLHDSGPRLLPCVAFTLVAWLAARRGGVRRPWTRPESALPIALAV